MNEIDFDATPEGMYYEPRQDGFALTASTRSCAPFVMIPFTLIWGGLSVGFIYGKQLIHWKFDAESSLYGLPFLLITLVLIWGIVYSMYGEIRITIADNRVEIFNGVGTWGTTRRFNLDQITSVEERYTGGDTVNYEIVLSGQKNISFGGALTLAQRQFTADVFRKLIAKGQVSET